MGTRQYLRKVSIKIAKDSGEGLDFKDFRCQFSVIRGDFQNPNTADLRVYNVNDDTVNKIRPVDSEFTTLTIQAGYEGNFNQIFSGSIKQVRTGREDQLDTTLDITAADGDRAYNFAPISASLEAQAAKSSDLAAALLTTMKSHGITQETWPEFLNNAPVRGRVLYGLSRDELRDFAWNNKCSWSIQDGKLTFIPFESYLPGEVPVLSFATGLIGIPEQSANGIKMELLLNPAIKIGQIVKLDNKSAMNLYRYGLDLQSGAVNPYIATSIKLNADGLYYVMVANHHGDTRGNDWYTDIECLGVDATVPSIDALHVLTVPEKEYVYGGKGAPPLPRYQ